MREVLDGMDLRGVEGLQTVYDESTKLWGMADGKGSVVIPAKYFDIMWVPRDGALCVEQGGGGWCVYNHLGDPVACEVFSNVRYANGGFVRVERSDAKGGGANYLNITTGEYLLPKWFDGNLQSFSEGLGRLEYAGQVRYVSSSGDLSPPFRRAHRFSGGLAAVKASDDKKWGYINKRFKFSIPPQFDQAGRMSEGMAAVVVEEKVGYIDYFGAMVIPPQFLMGFDIQGGYAAVKTEEGWGIIDRKGKRLTIATPQESVFFAGVVYGTGDQFGSLSMNAEDAAWFYTSRLGDE